MEEMHFKHDHRNGYPSGVYQKTPYSSHRSLSDRHISERREYFERSSTRLHYPNKFTSRFDYSGTNERVESFDRFISNLDANEVQDDNKKMWYLGETVKKLYDLDQDPNRKYFLDEYFTFMKRRGASVTKVPVVAKLPLDLYRLYHVVQKLGGFAQVVKKRKWSRVVRELDLPASITSAAFTLRTQYMRLLYPYECEVKGISNNFIFSESHHLPPWLNPIDIQQRLYDERDESPQSFQTNSSLNERVSPQLFQIDSSLINEERYYVNKTPSAQSEDNICVRSNSLKNFNHDGGKAVRVLKRAKSEEIDRDMAHYEIYRPYSQEKLAIFHKKKIGVNNEENSDPVSEDLDSFKTQKRVESEESMFKKTKKFNLEETEIERHKTNYELDTLRETELKQHGRENTERGSPATVPSDRTVFQHETSVFKEAVQKYYGQEKELHMPLSYSAISDPRERLDIMSPHFLRTSRDSYSPSLPENAKIYSNSIHNRPSNAYLEQQRGYPETDHFRIKEHNLQGHGSQLFNPQRKPRLSTNPLEMNITVEERTETMMALSIVVNGICYTGTLLSNIRK